MKKLFLLFFALMHFGLRAQGFEILDPNLQVKNFRVEQGVYLPDVGTKGVMLIFEYNYNSDSKYLLTFLQNIRLDKYGAEVFKDSSSYLVMRPGQWSVARKFIPYRKMNLAEGEHDAVDIQISVPNLFVYKGVVKIEQPTRYFVNFNIRSGVPKPIAGYWDAGSPLEAAADVYWTISTDEGTFTAYQSKINNNTNALPTENADFYVLEGERLFLNIYDEDGTEDLFLGRYEIGLADSDLNKEELGQMFDKIVGMEFAYQQRKVIRQPISTYVRHDAEYLGRKGVFVIFEYHLSTALEGKQMRPLVGFKTKEDKVVDIPYLYALDNTVMPGQKMTLGSKGKLTYFIPYYAWNSSVYRINFLFEGDKEKAEAAPYFIHHPIEFEKYISYSAYSVEDNYRYQGTSGVKLSLSYKVKDLNRYSKLEINFLNADGSPAQYPIFPLKNINELSNPMEGHVYSEAKPEEEAIFDFFVPYLDLDTKVIRVEMNLVPDMKINLVAENSPKLDVPERTSDAMVNKVSEEAVFKEGDYGYVLSLDVAVPKLYQSRAVISIEAMRNGAHYLGYSVVGDILDQSAPDTLRLLKEKGTIFVIFPFRRLEASDRLEVKLLLKDVQRNIAISDTIACAYTLPAKVYNVETVLNLNAIQFDKSIPKTEGDVDWKYVVTVGTESKINKTLPYSLKGKEVKEKFSRSIRIHREDLIQIKLVNKDTSNKREIFLWSGDLGKFQQNKFKSSISNQTPVKKAKVSAKVDKRQLRRKEE